MAPRKSNAAHIESLGETMTAEESGLMEANRESEAAQPEPETPAPEVKVAPQTDSALESDDEDVIIDPADIDPQTGKAKKVNFGALHAERKKRQAAEADANKVKQDLATALGRFSILEQLAKQQTPSGQQVATAEVPDVNTDPVGHFRAVSELQAKELSGIKAWQQTQEANATAMNNVQQLTRIALSHEAEFSKKTPDYQEAANYVRSMRDQELQHMGYSDPAIRHQIIQQDALQIAAQALNGNLNAAEVVYNIAKDRGYAVKAAPLPKVSPDTKKLATIAAGQKQASPLGEANGSALAETSVDALLKMSDADFEKATKGDNWRKLFA